MNKARLVVTLTILVLFVAVIVVAVIISSHTSQQKPLLLPVGRGIPDREIVFSVDIGVLGFINSDGSGFVTRTVDLSSWAPINFSGTYIPQLEDEITWSPDGKYLAGRYSVTNRSAGIPFIVSIDGEFFRCPINDMSPYGPYRSWVLANTSLLTVDTDTATGQNEVVVVDMITCKRTAMLYAASSNSEALREATVSIQGWLAVSCQGSRHRELFLTGILSR